MRRRSFSFFSKAAFVLSLPLMLGVSPILRAEEREADPDPVNMFVDVQMVALPRTMGLPLVRELMDREKIEGAYARIQGLLDQGTAKLLGWPMLTTQSGNRAVFEASDELRHAVGFAPGWTTITVAKTKPAGADAQAAEAPRLLSGRNGAIEGVQIDPVVTQLEARDLGVTLEVEPVLSADHKAITMNIVSQHVRLKGMAKIAVEDEKTGEKVAIGTPEFEAMKSITSIVLKSGDRVLLGVFPISEPPDYVELFLLHAEVQ